MFRKNLLELLVKRESEYDAYEHAQGADDMDLIVSPKDGHLVAVAQVGGVHVCWMCFGQFVDSPTHKHRSVEFNCGGYGTRILLHSGCVTRASNRGRVNLLNLGELSHQARRFATQALKPFQKP